MTPRLFRGAGRDRRANVAMFTAIVMLPMLAVIGIAVDATRMWLAQSRMTAALDAAALNGAREISSATRNADIVNLFWANFHRSAPGSQVGFLGTNVTSLTVSPVDANTLSITAKGLLPTTFMSLFGIPNVQLSATNQAVRATYGMELALVLDNTGSMAGWPIQSVVSSATSLVNILYGQNTNGTYNDTAQNLWVSVVPFAAEVNIGPANTGWLQAGSYDASAYPAKSPWMGCVMARVKTGDDFTDATPVQAPFTAFLYPSTLGQYVFKINGKNTDIGDNSWSTTTVTDYRQATLSPNTAVGPNLGCPNLPVLPLTASRATVLATVSQMVANYRGGTFINLGLQAGWWTLSPNWRGLWGSPTLPLAYRTPFMRKVIVLMTDGNNEWYDWSGGAPGAGPAPWKNDGDADFTAYGRLKQNLMNLPNNNQANATANLNTRMSQMCSILKQNGIEIYAVLFNHDGSVASATQTLFQNCASAPDHYFLTPTSAQLQNAFTEIGSQLANLRISQ